jgi:sugar O-acyltransferase (sialic acid O-acetyltransferase NeuD family)
MIAGPDRPVIVLGGGGHARVLLDLLLELKATIIGVTTADGKGDPPLPGINILGKDDAVARHSPAEVQLVNAIGIATASDFRKRLQEQFATQGYRFPVLIHPGASISRFATLAEGCQIMAGCVIQAGAQIGRGTIVNTMASVDHDCRIGEFVHIAPGAHLSGCVTVGDCSLIGTGSSVIQDVRIGAMCTIGAGSAVVRDISHGQRVGGSPARVLPRGAQE